MTTIRYVYWQDGDMWLGHLEEFPDYMTQGETIQELQENLKDLFDELNSGNIPNVRRVAELQIA
jgi:predicted RNase H-like HicB family nuclease